MIMRKIQFGYILPQLPADPVERTAFVENIHRALALISGHFDSFHIIDHISVGDLESFTSLAYFAAQYPQFKFGHTVICQSYRNPALVAMMGANLQMLSGGRFLFGIGTGWHEEEYKAFGYDYPPASVRVDQLDEALHIITALWTQEKVTFTGKHYRVFEAGCEPKPVPVPPIMIGAFKPRTLRLTARYADEWNVSSTGVRRYQRLKGDLEQACAAVGRDPATLRRSWGGGCICRRDQGEAERLGGERYGRDPEDEFDFVGTPEQITADMRPFIDLGVSTFLFDCGGFPDLTTLELMASEVLPALNR